MKERVLRQFGFKQGIPLNPERWVRGERHGTLVDSWALKLPRKSKCRRNDTITRPGITAGTMDRVPSAEYMQWYSRVFRPMIWDPTCIKNHVIAARRELSIQEVHAVEEVDEEKNADEEAEKEVLLLGLDEAVEVAPFLEQRFNLQQRLGQGITIRQQNEGPNQVDQKVQIGFTDSDEMGLKDERDKKRRLQRRKKEHNRENNEA
ncbi:hypothetical protein AMTR_s00104p00044010 [Amborella trichopoda]|uniref:Aminotransferase-like plant mobile domain-containing protein n=1 Tax=Amborella trichopoda TaxID=13333 RepID=W1NY90_AMBTC|nr:hypothetical protein AMTR_s00104p00044010 [Amborella trichopoda]